MQGEEGEKLEIRKWGDRGLISKGRISPQVREPQKDQNLSINWKRRGGTTSKKGNDTFDLREKGRAVLPEEGKRGPEREEGRT